MKRALAIVLTLLGGCASHHAPADAGFTPLVRADSLGGWARRGGEAAYRAENGVIIGETRPNQPNTFLCTERTYADFELLLEFSVDPELNSGVQIRSAARPDGPRERVYGYQVEIDPSARAWTGGLYEESGRLWLQDLRSNDAGRAAFRQNEWNSMRVLCEGDHIRTWINGVPCADVHDAMTASGFIALQVHGVGKRVDPLRVRWRNIMIREF